MRIPLTFYSLLMACDGYGRAAGLNMQSLLENGAELYAQPMGDWSAADTPQAVYHLIDKPRIPTKWGIVQHWPPTTWDVCDAPNLIGYTMWETDSLPDWFRREVNTRCVAVAVPTAWCKTLFEAKGITRPVYVVPHPCDSVYSYGDRRGAIGSRPCVFGTLGTLSVRKGTDILIRCFANAFPTGREAVRLEIKVRGPYSWPLSDSRIVVHRGEWSTTQTRAWYQRLTSYVSPSHGEGFGLTNTESMQCGCAVVATNWSGPTEYLKEAYSYPLGISGLTPHTLRQWPEPGAGQWAVPNEEHLIFLLRHVYENQQEAREKGRLASRAIAAQFPSELPGKLLLDIIKEWE